MSSCLPARGVGVGRELSILSTIGLVASSQSEFYVAHYVLITDSEQGLSVWFLFVM